MPDAIEFSVNPHPHRIDLAVNRRGLMAWCARAAVGALAPLAVRAAKAASVRLALPDFSGAGLTEPAMARRLTEIVASDLQRSGLFARIDRAAFATADASADALPIFPDWEQAGIDALVTGRLSQSHDNRLNAQFRVWDVAARQQLVGYQYFTAPDAWRQIAHVISAAICERLTGEKIEFDPTSQEKTNP